MLVCGSGITGSLHFHQRRFLPDAGRRAKMPPSSERLAKALTTCPGHHCGSRNRTSGLPARMGRSHRTSSGRQFDKQGHDGWRSARASRNRRRGPLDHATRSLTPDEPVDETMKLDDRAPRVSRPAPATPVRRMVSVQVRTPDAIGAQVRAGQRGHSLGPAFPGLTAIGLRPCAPA